MKHTTFAHAMAYLGALIISALVYASTFDPNNLLFVGPQAVKYSALAVALAGAVLAALHNAGVIPNSARSSQSVTTVAKVLIPLVLILPLLHGCATLTKIGTAISSPNAQPYLTAAADVAVATAEAKGVTAAQITSIAQQALAADQGSAATLNAVAAVANAQIAKLKLPAGDMAAAQILEAALEVAVQSKIGGNASVAQAQAAIAELLNAIITSANPGGVVAVGTSSAPTAYVAPASVPAQNKQFSLASVESPELVGASSSLLLVSSLQAFKHISVSAPLAAAITVLFTVGAAAIDNLIS